MNCEPLASLMDALSAFENIHAELASLIPIPEDPELVDWPCQNEAERDVLQTVYLVSEGMINTMQSAIAETEPKARLIAAAPELLDFAQQIFAAKDTGLLTLDTPADETLANVLSRGRAAILKATGGQS